MNVTTVKSADGAKDTYDEDNEKYFNKYHPDFVPGTINIFLEDKGHDGNALKTTEEGIVLHPQPSDSPNDPLNWSLPTKVWQAFLVCFISAMTAAASNSTSAASYTYNTVYGISYNTLNVGTGLLFISVLCSVILLSPLPFLYGRKINYCICMTMGLIGAIWFGYVKDAGDSIGFQIFIGISVSCAEASAQLTMADLLYSHQIAWGFTFYIIAISSGCYLGPLIGGIIVEQNPVGWIGWSCAIFYGFLLLLLVTTQFETYFDRSKYVNADLEDIVDAGYTGIDNVVMETSECKETAESNSFNDVKDIHLLKRPVLSNSGQSFNSLIGNNGRFEEKKSYFRRISLPTRTSNLRGSGFQQYFKIIKNILTIMWFPPVILSGVLWGLQDAFLTFYLTTESEIYFYPPYNYSSRGVSIMNIPCLIGAIIGCLYAGWFAGHGVTWIAKRRNGVHEPEDYLYFLVLVFICCPIGMMIFATGTEREWDWRITYTLGLGFIGVGWGGSGDIAMSYLASTYPEMVMEGMVGVSVINNSIACIFTFTSHKFLTRVGTINTYAVLISFFIVACLSAIPLIMYGKRMRMATKSSYIRFVETRDGVQKEVEVAN